MPTTVPWSRRRFLTATAGLGAVAVAGAAACGHDDPGTVAGDGSVTIEHAFGSTRIPRPPSRVVSAGYAEQDDLLALGVTPIAVTEWFGQQPFATWPWALPKLAGAQPVVLTLDDGIQVDRIAALRPDLIVATNSGLDADAYAKLTAIAPTVAQSGRDAFFESWKDQAGQIGAAVFQRDQATAKVSAIDDSFTKAGTANPSFAGKKALLVGGAVVGEIVEVTASGWRTDFLTKMGLSTPDGLDAFPSTGGVARIPRSKAADVLDAADVLIWTTESDEQQAALRADPWFAGLSTTRAGHAVITEPELAAAVAFASLLSWPVVADRLPPMIARALA